MTTVRFEDVDGDDVAPMAVVSRKYESRDLIVVLGHQAVGASKAKIIAEVAARICDSRLVACLVDCVERLKIQGLIFSEPESRRHKLFVPQKITGRKTKMAELPVRPERSANFIAAAARIAAVVVSPSPVCSDRRQPRTLCRTA